ncbi:MAG: type II toxin-antitoxin system RatA family toxin [Solirubrobacterales bacterium]
MAALTGVISADFPRHTREQLFAVASDIERYPEFIPWCRRARVLSCEAEVREVDNHFGAGPADISFRSRAVAAPPEQLEISAADGPFRTFRLVWTFAAVDSGCRVRAEYEVLFRSGMLQALARLTIHEVERRVLRTFRDRARALYGA